MRSYAFLFWAYTLIWAGIAGYLLFLFARMRRLDRRLAQVERELGADQKSSRS